MTHCLPGPSAPALTGRRPVPWRAFLSDVVEIVRVWLERRRQRQELMQYMADDHRAVADLRVSLNDARDWASRPFWRG